MAFADLTLAQRTHLGNLILDEFTRMADNGNSAGIVNVFLLTNAQQRTAIRNLVTQRLASQTAARPVSDTAFATQIAELQAIQDQIT